MVQIVVPPISEYVTAPPPVPPVVVKVIATPAGDEVGLLLITSVGMGTFKIGSGNEVLDVPVAIVPK